MTSNVTCDYSAAAWEFNSRNETACQVYAQLQAQCDSSFIIQPVVQASPPYTPPNNFCGCNVVAYNLMAGCAWCQLPIQSGWWSTISQWAGNCTAAQFNPTAIPASIVTDNIVIPQWALAIPTGTTWNPSQASDIAAPPRSTTTTSSSTQSNSFVTLPRTTNSSTSRDLSFSTNTTTASDVGQSVGIAFGVILGLWALSTILVVVIYFSRQTQRKAWYAPMAAFYQAQKGGYNGGAGAGGYAQYPPHGQVGSAVPLVYPNQYQGSGSPSNTTTVSSGVPTTPYHPPPPDANGFYPSTAVGYNATPYVPPPPDANHQVGAPSGYVAPAAWGANTTSVYGSPGNAAGSYGAQGNTASIYGGSQTALAAPGRGGGLPQGPPPGAQGGYRGHAEVY